MKTLAITAALALVLIVAAPVGATAAKGPTLKSLQAQIVALQKQVKTLKKQVNTDRNFSLGSFLYSGCAWAVTADALQNTWTTLDTKLGTTFGAQTPVNDYNACQSFQIVRARTHSARSSRPPPGSGPRCTEASRRSAPHARPRARTHRGRRRPDARGRSPLVVRLGAPADGLLSSEQAVPDTPDVENAVLGAGLGELAPEPGGMRIERPGPSERPEAPDVAKELLLGEDARGLGRQLHQQLVLLGRERDRQAVHGYAAGRAIDRDRTRGKPLARRRVRPPQHR